MGINKRFTGLFGVDMPIIQAPMAGSSDIELAIAVSEAGGLGSLPCAMLSADQVRSAFQAMRQRTSRPVNLNFFCHRAPSVDTQREREWREHLASYYAEFGIDASAPFAVPNRTPFDEAMCEAVVDLKPPVVSFHFGLPSKGLLDRVRSTGARIISSATTVEEARWLEREGCDAVIAQGFEAGGHRGMFLRRCKLAPRISEPLSLVPRLCIGNHSRLRGRIKPSSQTYLPAGPHAASSIA